MNKQAYEASVGLVLSKIAENNTPPTLGDAGLAPYDPKVHNDLKFKTKLDQHHIQNQSAAALKPYYRELDGILRRVTNNGQRSIHADAFFNRPDVKEVRERMRQMQAKTIDRIFDAEIPLSEYRDSTRVSRQMHPYTRIKKDLEYRPSDELFKTLYGPGPQRPL